MRHAEPPMSAKALDNARPMGSGVKPAGTRTAQQVMSAYNKGIALPRMASASSPSVSAHEFVEGAFGNGAVIGYWCSTVTVDEF